MTKWYAEGYRAYIEKSSAQLICLFSAYSVVRSLIDDFVQILTVKLYFEITLKLTSVKLFTFPA